jgi:hypothetical protein
MRDLPLQHPWYFAFIIAFLSWLWARYQPRTWTTIINVNNLQAVAWMRADVYRLALYAAWTVVDTLTMMVNSYVLFLIIALLVGRQGVPAFAMGAAGAFGALTGRVSRCRFILRILLNRDRLPKPCR